MLLFVKAEIISSYQRKNIVDEDKMKQKREKSCYLLKASKDNSWMEKSLWKTINLMKIWSEFSISKRKQNDSIVYRHVFVPSYARRNKKETNKSN